MSVETLAPASARVRSGALDRLRGAAIVFMMIDHVTLIVGGPMGIRWSVGRLAMPIFFILGGHLARRLTWRHAGVGLLGVVLTVVAPWAGTPNILVQYAMSVVLLVLAARLGSAGPAVLGVIALTVAANGVGAVAGAYPPALLVALMVAGHYLPRAWLERIAPAGVGLGMLGRHPVAMYAGHVLLLDLALVTLR